MTTPAAMPPIRAPFKPPKLTKLDDGGVFALTKKGTRIKLFMNHEELRYLLVQAVELLEDQE
ncbi:hypothetical protein HMPREF3169_05275 [Corynebacterium sp. HMSC08C04]|uniref:hypothetical protein n=1 Tax=Corynebacterium sp. HMSC08C04 TaxID=1581137 RepID=UPI0008A1B3A0|nr:hypothetical protein [Corynebacterium sp. HMSC08C04]OFT34655.1 hypothetical protein HMPREF3169_05275 [Corynebacterium sp. HMSC08C04]